MLRRLLFASLFFLPTMLVTSNLARGEPLWIQSLYILIGMTLVGTIYVVLSRLYPRITGWEGRRTEVVPHIRIDVACALIGMSALNATLVSVLVQEPALFLLAMVGNILIFVAVCWLLRERDDPSTNPPLGNDS